jgi:hypothetical protein
VASSVPLRYLFLRTILAPMRPVAYALSTQEPFVAALAAENRRGFSSEAAFQNHSTQGGGHHDGLVGFSGLWCWRIAAVGDREIEGRAA